MIVDHADAETDPWLRELERGGFTVRHRHVGDQPGLVDALESSLWDIIVADPSALALGMRAFVDVVRRAHRHTPIFLVTDTADDDHVSLEAAWAGAADVIARTHIVRLAPAVVREVRRSHRPHSHHRAAGLLDWHTERDALTGLPDRRGLMSWLQHTVDKVHMSPDHERARIAVITIDINSFKEVNNALGYLAGDLILKELAVRLKECLRPGDFLARRGGDEFVVVITGGISQTDAYGIVDRLMEAVQRPIYSAAKEIYLTATLGGCVFPDHAATALALLSRADRAIADAQGMRGCCHWYRGADEGPDTADVVTAAVLRHAIDREQLVLFYQPLVHLQTGKLYGFESLLRWRTPGGTLVQPGDFIPLAEATGLIVPIGDWAFREACRQIRAWEIEGCPTRVCVNISARQLDDPGLVDRFASVLRESGIDRRHVGLELTETALLSSEEQYVSFCDLAALGVGLALDDFGVGYSSLALLSRMPARTVKIDRSFVDGMLVHPRDRTLVESVIQLAHMLGLRVVAEGVASQEQWEIVRSLGCDIAQGYLVGEPLPQDEAFDYLRSADRLLWMEEDGEDSE